MRVQEIISEVWYNPMTWGKSNPPAADTAKIAKAVEKVTPKEAAAALKNIKKSPAAYKAVLDKRIAAGEFARDIEKARTGAISRMGGVWWSALKLAGLAVATYQLIDHLAAVDADYMAGQRKDGVEFNEQDYKDWRKFYIGLWEAQIALPAIVRLVKAAASFFYITRAIVAIIGTMGSVATFGGALFGFISTELLTQAIQAWLMTPSGQEWCVKNMWGPLVLAGEVGEDAWLILYKGATGVAKAVKSGDISDVANGDNFYADKKAERAKDPRLAARDADLGDQGDINSGKNTVMVGGTRITDQDGKLLPGIESAPRVKYALQYGTQAEKDAFARAKAMGSNIEKQYVDTPSPAVINPTTGKVADRDPKTGKLVDRP